MLKKLVAVMTAFMVIFGASSFMFVDHAAAKSYKSGKKSFTPSSGQKSKVDLNKRLKCKFSKNDSRFKNESNKYSTKK